MARDIYICAAKRTPIGTFMGSLSGFSPAELGAITAEAALAQAGLDARHVDSLVVGNIIATSPQTLYVARDIGRRVGVPDSATALNVNRACGSGVQAIISGALEIASGTADVVLAGGSEVMSQAPYTVDGMRRGKKMGDGRLTDWLTGLLSCPFGNGHMGVTAENVAEKYGVSREDQDRFAELSQSRAAAAIAGGEFVDQIVPVAVKTRKGEVSFDTDEHPRETTVETLAKLPAVFAEGGSVTAGNASGINDGACMLVLASGDAVQEHGLSPLGVIRGWGIAGVPPEIMGIGPVAAVPKALQHAGLSLDDIGVIESNEAFAAQAVAVSRELGFDEAKTNPQGGAIALGHPVGATGAILTTKALYYQRRNNVRFGLVTLCIGGGQGIALVVENLAFDGAK
nr:acetyl-CoA C-acyltransferase [Corynebacterium aquilae]